MVPKRPSLRVYDPFYGRPPAARHTGATQPLFLPIEKVNSRRVSPVIARTQIGFIHGQLSYTRVTRVVLPHVGSAMPKMPALRALRSKARFYTLRLATG